MTHNLNHISKLKILFIVPLFLIGCQPTKEKELLGYLTNDSISMWNITIQRKVERRDTSYIHHYFRSLSFSKDYTCEQYIKTIYDERIIDFLGPEPNYLGLCNKWSIINDSMVKLNCRDVFVVKMINKDTLHLLDTLGIKKHEMYRVDSPWNINEESVKKKEKMIESGEYLKKPIDIYWW